jgi:hypothetical protein
MVLSAVAVLAARRGRRPAGLARVAAAARQHVVTAAALAAFDAGMWHWGPGVGWIGVCVSLLALDFAVAG